MDYQDFSAVSGIDGMRYDCRFRTLILGISVRHSDTADIQFLVNGKPVIVALPLVAFAEYRNRQGRVLTDGESIQIAGKVLKDLLEQEVLPDDRIVVPSKEQTLNVAGSITSVSPVEQPSVVPKLVTT